MSIYEIKKARQLVAAVDENKAQFKKNEDEIMTKEGNKPGPKITTTFSCHGCSLCVSASYHVQSDSGFDIYCTHGGAKKDIGNGNWNTPGWCPFRSQPTPPTPAGAGTETPRTDFACGLKPGETPATYPGYQGCISIVSADFARQLEREVTALRAQLRAVGQL